MKLKLIYTLAFMYTLSAYSSELTKKEVSTTITDKGKHFFCKDAYDKLLAISGTLQNDNAEHGTPNPANLPEVQEPYYEIDHDTQYLQYITDYISTDNTHAYLNTLSLVQLIHLYQNADYWSLETPILDNLRTYIVEKLQNKDVLNDIFSTQESLDTFLNACNSQTKATLAHTLLPYVGNLFWPSVHTASQKLTDHTSWIQKIALHTDGTLFSSSNDNTIHVWKPDAQGTYHCVQTLTGHTSWIYSVAVHTDGTLFSGSGDFMGNSATIRVWKPDAQGTYHCVQTLTDHTGYYIRSVAVHTDGTLFSGTEDGTIKVWKVNAQGTYERVQTLTGHTNWINSLVINVNGALFSGAEDKTIKVWKVNAQGEYECIQTLTGHKKRINRVVVHTDDTLFSSSDDHTIRVWKIDKQGNYTCAQILPYHGCVRVNANGTLFSGSPDCTVRIWTRNAQNKYSCIHSLRGHTGEILSVAVHTDGTLFSGSADGTIRVWKAPIVPLSLEQCMTVTHLYHQYQDNNTQQLHNLPTHIQAIYNTFPYSIKLQLKDWNKPTYLPYKKFFVTGLSASIIGAGYYLYYKWFRK
ncbi:WD40 repeat domain-containing protein [Vermiphilus pyriformis]|nr:MAG: WD40 repeat domain-containing protein [Vermiphilus pyriformis]